MTVGIVLAAGESSRMKHNKMLLHFKNKTIIEHTVHTMMKVCSKIIIVTGHYKEDYKRLFNYNNSIFVVHNEDYKQGMFSSVLTGVAQVNQEDVFIIPGDYPLVKVKTYLDLLKGTKTIRVPVYENHKGHPIFLSSTVIDDLKNEPVNSNLKVFRDKHNPEYITVDDKHIHFDVDTQEDYQRLVQLERVI